MMDALLAWPTWPLVVGLMLLMYAANELGFRLGHTRRKSEPEPSRAVSNGLKASIFGLVAFLLGFSFSMTSNRYDAKRSIVLNEANAIGTCYLRAELLEPAFAQEIQGTLRSYVQSRLNYFEHSLNSEASAENLAKMDTMMDDLWTEVSQAVKADPQLARTAQIIPAANEVIDLHSTRAAAVRNHLPNSVLFLLLISVLVSSMLIGHSSGQSHRRHLGLWIAFNVLFAMVLYVVLDFDRPRRGLVQVSHVPLVELLSKMQMDTETGKAE